MNRPQSSRIAEWANLLDVEVAPERAAESDRTPTTDGHR
jgi:hypothetical protein